MKRMTCFVMALALVLGLAQCKKEQLKPENKGEKVTITLDVKGNNNAKVDVDPPYVTFESGDEIQVACNGHHVGTLTHDGTKFIGDLTNVTPGQPLYFYFFGNVSPQYFGTNKESCTVYIGEQTGELPVISMGPSINKLTNDTVYYSPGCTSYSAKLHNKCSLMKFNVTTDSDSTICINGMKNFVRVDFTNAANVGENNGFTYDMVYDGLIKMAGVTNGNTETWVIVLRQDPVGAGVAYTEDGYIGTRPAIGEIESNQFYSAGVDMTLNSYNSLAIPLTFEARENGAKVSFSKVGSPDGVSLEISINGGKWMAYNVNSPSIITLTEGQKVMFRGKNTRFATSPSNYHKFSIVEGGCYVYGNIMSLIDSTGFVTATSLGDYSYTFESLFAECEGICEHDMMTLELPATTLASYCYSHMFSGCINLTEAPKLPASGLREGCYSGMFDGCINLPVSPELPATTLVTNCYSSMFRGCKNLCRITCLAEQGIDYLGSTENWVSGAGTGEDVESPTFYKKSGVPTGSGEEGIFWPTNSPNGIPNGWSVQEQ